MINWYHISVQEMPRRLIRHGGGAKDMRQKLGLGFFVLLSFLGVMGVFFLSTDTASLAQVADRINIDYLLLCIFVVPVVDWLIAGFRMWLFTQHMLGRFVAWAQTKKRVAIWVTRLSTHPNDSWETLIVLIRRHKLRL
mgnify:CR=1 FL=1